jgi:hypothetical protein
MATRGNYQNRIRPFEKHAAFIRNASFDVQSDEGASDGKQ